MVLIVHRAADRVLAEQCALRPAQHLHAVDIDSVHHAADRAGIIDVVDIETDARIAEDREIILADAADEHGGVVIAARQRGGAIEADVGRELRDLVERGDAAIFERGGAERRDGDRHVLQPFRPAAGGHQDVIALDRHCVLRAFAPARWRRGVHPAARAAPPDSIAIAPRRSTDMPSFDSQYRSSRWRCTRSDRAMGVVDFHQQAEQLGAFLLSPSVRRNRHHGRR